MRRRNANIDLSACLNDVSARVTLQGMVTHAGGCHCGRVRFEVTAPARLEVSDCNCSICAKSGYLHLIVPAEQFSLVAGRDDLNVYTFNTGVAKHYFCCHCGVKSFYVPRSHPNGVSVNVRCIDSDTVESLSVTPFDGRNWEHASARSKDVSSAGLTTQKT